MVALKSRQQKLHDIIALVTIFLETWAMAAKTKLTAVNINMELFLHWGMIHMDSGCPILPLFSLLRSRNMILLANLLLPV